MQYIHVDDSLMMPIHNGDSFMVVIHSWCRITYDVDSVASPGKSNKRNQGEKPDKGTKGNNEDNKCRFIENVHHAGIKILTKIVGQGYFRSSRSVIKDR